jgi:hypothetical protein
MQMQEQADALLASLRRWWVDGQKTDQQVIAQSVLEVPKAMNRLAVCCLNPVSAAHESQIKQLKFLLASAPMIDAPSDHSRLSASKSPFAYVHPKTMAQMLRTMRLQGFGRSFLVFPGSPTKWVAVSSMPEGRVIYSPLPIPGLEKILAQ